MASQQWFVFTFGSGQPNEGKYVRVFGTFEEARVKMIEKYGRQWGFQYTSEQWSNWIHSKPEWLPAETLLEEIK